MMEIRFDKTKDEVALLIWFLVDHSVHLQYLSIICLWFKIWPTPAKNYCYAHAPGWII
jgi:hypothetical protein